MRSPLGTLATLINRAPVPYVGRHQGGQPWMRPPAGNDSTLRAMGSVGTLFAIVDRLATSTAAPTWRLYRTAASGDPADRTEVTRHAALDLWRKPNKFFTRSLFVETGQQHFDLVGETWWVVARDRRLQGLPLELWPVRPDRMEPIPDHRDYLVGYVYCGPDGEQVPLGLDEVIQIRRPNPIDAYRGIGPVQTIKADLEGVQLSAEWNRNFFRNSAEPGGILQFSNRLSDEQFNELRDRWAEQHRGVANAHRVAILEGGEWIDRKYTNRDMQFAELRTVASHVIREAYAMPKFAVGDVDDVNRATADASSAWFSEQMTVPRLERIKAALNEQLLPMYGATARGLEFDYDSPVQADREADRQDLTAAAAAARDLVDAGYYAPEVLEAVGLPEIAFGQPGADPERELLIELVKGAPAQLAPLLLPLLGIDVPEPPAPEPAPAPPEPAPPVEPTEDDTARAILSLFDLARAPRARAEVIDVDDGQELPELRAAADDPITGVRDDLEAALSDLMQRWEDEVVPGQIDDLVEQVESAVDAEDLEALATLTVDTAEATTVLREALADMASTAAARMVDEAAAQGVTVAAPPLDEELTARGGGTLVNFGAELAVIAVAAAAMIGAELAASAGREALRLFQPGREADPGTTGQGVATRVRGFLSGLRGRARKQQLGGALHRATNVGRLAVLEQAPAATYVATEVNDSNRCDPCTELDGTEFTDLAEAWATYASGGYADCEGGVQCRGTIRAIWTSEGDG